MKYQIPILLGTSRKGNQSRKVAQYILNKLEDLDEVSTQLLDLEAARFPVMEERLGVWENPPVLLAEWSDLLKAADAVVIVAPEYKNSIPGSLKNFLDFLPGGIFRYKPIGISTVTSGSHGGTNCLAHLRLISISLAGLPIPDRFQISNVVKAFDEAGNLNDLKAIAAGDKFVVELIKYTRFLTSSK